MAWPLSAIQTFLANSVPVISAQFLNRVQGAIVDLFNGVISLKALVVDGTGANVVAPTAGDVVVGRSVKVARTVSGTTAPTATCTAGELARGMVPVGWARLDNARALVRGANVYAVNAGLGAGIYEVTFDRVLGSADSAPFAQLISTSARLFTSCFVDAGGVGGRVRVTVSVFDKDGVATDPGGLALVLFGE